MKGRSLSRKEIIARNIAEVERMSREMSFEEYAEMHARACDVLDAFEANAFKGRFGVTSRSESLNQVLY